MIYDVIPARGTRMSQAFPEGTMEVHDQRLCWCHPRYKFQRLANGEVTGVVIHQ